MKNSLNTHVRYRVFSASGKEISEGVCSSNNSKELQVKLNGIYFVQISNNQSIFVKKVAIF